MDRPTNHQASRRDRALKSPSDDPYHRSGQLSDPTVCPDCSAVFRRGRWTWSSGPVDAPRVRCSACQRIADDYAAGFLNVMGSFALENEREVGSLLRNVEEEQKAEHPVKRIMDVVRSDEGIQVRTTDAHLAPSLGKALRSAYGGDLTVAYEEDVVRVTWTR